LYTEALFKLPKTARFKILAHHASPIQDAETSPVAMEGFFVLVECWTTNVSIDRKRPLINSLIAPRSIPFHGSLFIFPFFSK
jgi:hypothetical protein